MGKARGWRRRGRGWSVFRGVWLGGLGKSDGRESERGDKHTARKAKPVMHPKSSIRKRISARFRSCSGIKQNDARPRQKKGFDRSHALPQS
jgi:hypothetical protein